MKKTAKKLVALAVAASAVFALAGCGDKTAVTSNEFSATMETNGYEVVTDADGIYDPWADSGYTDDTVYAVAPDGGYTICFYDMPDAATGSSATVLYNSVQQTYESYKGNSSSEKNVSAGNHSKYTLTSGGYYYAVSRIDDTVVFVSANSDYKSEINDALDSIGY